MDYSRDVAIPAVSAEYPVAGRSQGGSARRARIQSGAPFAEATAARADFDTSTGGAAPDDRVRSASGEHSNGRAGAGRRW